MNSIAFIIAFVAMAGFVSAHTSIDGPPRWAASVTVIDETNHPLPDATVEVSYYIKPPSGSREATDKTVGATDDRGVFLFSHENTGSIGLGFRASKLGYYACTTGYQFGEYKDELGRVNK